MNRADIKTLMRDVFGRNFQMQDQGLWVGMRCPLAPWTHEKGHDGSPSAGVSVVDDGQSIFNCFTCRSKGTSGPLSRLLQQYSDYSGKNYDALIEEIEEGEFLGPTTSPSYDQLLEHETEVLMPINEGIYMDLYDSAVGHPYLRERGISDNTAEKLELLFDPEDSEGDARILFPVRGPDGLLYGFSGRAISSKARLKVRDYHGLPKSRCVLGSHMGGSADRIVVVEGLIDTALVFEFGEVGHGLLHASLTDAQAEIIQGQGKPTFLMLDNDQAGHDGTERARLLLQGHVPLFGTKYPKVKVPDKSERGWHWLKDPGEMYEDEFLGMLDKARLF